MALVPVLLILAFCTPAAAQNNRGVWMWSSPSHPYGGSNVLGNSVKEAELIADFGAWNFDRIYASYGAQVLNDPPIVANWNASLDDVGMRSELLLGLVDFSPTSISNLVQTRLIDFNDARTDPREHVDDVHLDIEPHGSNAWKNGTGTDKRDLLYKLRDTYTAVRATLDQGGYPEVKIYADLPVWYDSTTAVSWTRGDRTQWFADIGVALDGITMMAYERSTLSSIQNGISWEVANFNGDIRVGLNVAEIGPGNTFADFEAVMTLASEIEAYYGTDITGVDFHAVIDYIDEAPTPTFNADFDVDGDVDGADWLALQRGFGILSGATSSDGDANGSGSVNVSDLVVFQEQYGQTLLTAAFVVPEPCGTLLSLAVFVGEFVFRGGLLFRTARICPTGVSFP
ncbi:hypothetical protein Pr1d_20240 [Bythopirellula goksoeyrii]|uniref:Dockerin domain-containing protein n=2 Tax=Bythopirellula goksoeyrii TaxID=1400387 RepID=A0A5B9QB57_9BACT|nr:hypothetical protein Pr1d_20240 [Bythopirellula goksoeyrii]